MPAFDRQLKQAATLWSYSGMRDQYGQVQLDAPRCIPCFWEERVETFRDEQGEQRASTAIVHVGEQIPRYSWLALGVHTDTDPQLVPEAFEVKANRATPSLRDPALKTYEAIM